MNAIILIQSQADALRVARKPNDLRILEPRRLQDGRLILNADILDDPFFSDPSRPWAAILAGQKITTEEQPDQAQSGEVSLEIQEAVVESLAQVRSRIVTLTEAELAEPQSD